MFNPADPAAMHDCSAYVGWLDNGQESWWRPGSACPQRVVRACCARTPTVEALADYAASRTIWIAQTDEIFVASTSQRAIPYFLGSLEPNPTAQAWMLSAGTLGPSPGGTGERARWVRTARRGWTVLAGSFRSASHGAVPVDPSPDDVHAARLREALESTLGNLRLDHCRWILPLSGGFDSRAILLMMNERRGLRTVTWGRKEALGLPGNDAYVAPRVAAALGVEHQYYETDLSDEPVEKLFDRYLVAGDGRTGGFLAYMDGFRTWRTFFESGIRGVIRGDHGFGPGPAPAFTKHSEVLHFNSMARWRDHPGLPSLGQVRAAAPRRAAVA